MPKQITGIILEIQSHFGERYPDVPLASNIDYEALVAGDDDPMFVTLPIGAVNTTSRNGRSYGESEVRAIVNTIVNEKSIGQKGHLRDDERAYRFDIPPLVWVGATLEADGKAYGKAYVLRNAPEVREYIKVAKASKAKVGTSIYGMADIDEDGNVTNLQIESIDLAHPARLGVEMASAVPQITSESVRKPDTEEENPVPVEETNIPVQEAEPKVIVEMKRAHAAAVRELDGRIAELQGAAADLAVIAEMLGADDPINAVRILQTHVSSLRKENGILLEESIVSQVEEAVQVKNLRGMIAEMVREKHPSTRDAVKNAIEAVLEKDHVKEALKDAVIETSGPKQARPVTQPSADAAETPLIHIPGVN